MAQQLRLDVFLKWLIVVCFGFGILEGIAFFLFRDTAFGIASTLTLFALGCFRYAQIELHRDHPQTAAIVLCATFTGVSLAGTFAWPNLLPMLVFLPVLALVIVLPFVHGRALYRLVIIAWLVILTIAIIDELQPTSSIAPSWSIGLFRVSSLSAAAALLFLLLVEGSKHLMAMLKNLESANQSLQLTQAQLHETLQEREAAVAQQHQLRLQAEAAQADLAFLAEASGILGSSLEYQVTLTNIAQLAVPYLADMCGIYLFGETGELEELTITHRNPGKAEILREILQYYPPTRQRRADLLGVIQRGQPVIYSHYDTLIQSLAQDDQHMRLLRALNLSSYMVVPLRVGEQPVGVLLLGRNDPLQRYGPQHLPLVQELAQRVATAVEHAQLYQAAQDAISLREQFLSIASHELKTPLTAMLGFADLLLRRTQRDKSLPDRDQRILQLVREQGSRLERLIETLLDVSRIERGQLQIEPAVLDLVALTQKLVDQLQPTLEQHSVVFQSAEQALFVNGDALRLEQVLHNLISNAIKYSPHGGTITVQAEHREQSGVVTVVDQGIGIPAAALPYLFQRFYRASNADSHYISGMGIGLYLAHEIVTLHGGTLEVASSEGEGSSFSVVLPLAAHQPAAGTLATDLNNPA